jgi:nucleotide-binding universal stress UspA family protein
MLPEEAERREKTEQAAVTQLKESLQALEGRFKEAGIKYSFTEEALSLSDILKRSVYADLIIADALLNVPGVIHPSLNVSIRELLADAHCPVLLLREGDMPPDRIVLSYDGSDSSMQAIRSFSYLFPNLRYIPSVVVHVAGKEQKEPADMHYLKDWLPLHFDDATVEILPGNPAEVLPAFVNTTSGSTLVIMGAYGRSALSRLFRQSLANSILEKANASLFVTHER